MKLWLDGQCLQTASRRRGVGRYVMELLTALSERSEVELAISFNAAMPDAAIAARDEMRGLIASENIHLWHGLASAGEAETGRDDRRRLSEIALSHHADALAPDVAIAVSPFEGEHDQAVALTPGAHLATPVAAFFYDAIPLRFPARYLPSRRAKATYQRRFDTLAGSRLNLCISEFAESESRELLPGVAARSISAGVPRGFMKLINSDESGVSPEIERLGKRPFALYVGGLDWRKNVPLIIDAFAKLRPEVQQDSDLVIAGDHPQNLVEDLRRQWRRNGLLAQNFICLGHTSDVDLVALYRRARTVVQPSFMEGFGLVALEAIACGAPVLASRTGALAEVVGHDQHLFDPDSSDELAALLEHILTDAQFAGAVSASQAGQARALSWERSAGLAINALTETFGANLARSPPDLPELRLRTAAQLAGIDLPSDVVARTMALAEPEPAGRRRLVVDATQVAQVDYGTGIQRVVKSICANIPSATSPDCDRVVAAHPRGAQGWFAVDQGKGRLQLPPADERPGLRFGANDTLLMLDSSWEHWREHAPTLAAARMRGAEVVSCLYDMIPLRMPGYCDPGMPPMFAEWFASALRYSTAFVCISKAIADELAALLEALEFKRSMKIGYWRLGADFAPLAEGARKPIASPRPTFLMVGTLEPRKGHGLALRAFEQLWAAGIDVSLVIAGRRGWGVDPLAERIIAHPEFNHRLIWRTSVSDEELRAIYASCDALVAASYGEGFGLPIVEAGRFGKPVIASDIPVFREVGEGAPSVRFFASGDAKSLASEIRGWLAQNAAGKVAASKVKPVDWPDWSASAAELEALILENGWQHVYQPHDPHAFVEPADLSRKLAPSRIPGRHQLSTLKILEGPWRDAARKVMCFTVLLSNASSLVWTNAGGPSGSHSVSLGYRVVEDDVLLAENPRAARFPFVLAPNNTCTLLVEVPDSWADRPTAQVEFAVCQDGAGWWPDHVSLPLNAPASDDTETSGSHDGVDAPPGSGQSSGQSSALEGSASATN